MYIYKKEKEINWLIQQICSLVLGKIVCVTRERLFFLKYLGLKLYQSSICFKRFDVNRETALLIFCFLIKCLRLTKRRNDYVICRLLKSVSPVTPRRYNTQ